MRAPALLAAGLACASCCLGASVGGSLASGRITVSQVGPRRVWRFIRGAGTSPVPIPWPIGHNHPHSLWDPCDPADAECISNDLFNRLYGGNLARAAAAQLQQYADWGFNAAGYDAPEQHRAKLPFMSLTMPMDSAQGGGPSFWQPDLVFPDPWDLDFVAAFSSRIQTSCTNNAPNAANLLGTIWTDTPAFDIRKAQRDRGQDWVTTMRCLPPGAAGLREYRAFLQARYGGAPGRICTAYGAPAANCSSWDTLELCGVRNLNVPAAMADDYAFLPEIVSKYYAVGNATFRQCDPEGLLFGDTIRTLLTPDSVIEVMSRYVDVISYQPDGVQFNGTELGRIHMLSGGKPMVIADIGFGFPHAPYDRTEWIEYPSQQAAGAAYSGFVSGAVKSGFVVGLNKCEYIDRSIMQPDRTLKPGTLSFDGTEHQPFTAALKAANAAARALAALDEA